MRASAPRVWIPASAGMTRARAARFLPPQERRRAVQHATMRRACRLSHHHERANTPESGGRHRDAVRSLISLAMGLPRADLLRYIDNILYFVPSAGGTRTKARCRRTLPLSVRRTAHARVCAARLDSSLRWNDEGQGCEVPASAGTTARRRHDAAPRCRLSASPEGPPPESGGRHGTPSGHRSLWNGPPRADLARGTYRQRPVYVRHQRAGHREGRDAGGCHRVRRSACSTTSG